MMSNAQVLYLQYIIAKKLRQGEQGLRKRLAHHNLWERIQPLAARADNAISESQGALFQAIEETKSWLEVGNQGRMGDLEQDISMWYNCEQLAHVNLMDAPPTNRPQEQGETTSGESELVYT